MEVIAKHEKKLAKMLEITPAELVAEKRLLDAVAEAGDAWLLPPAFDPKMRLTKPDGPRKLPVTPACFLLVEIANTKDAGAYSRIGAANNRLDELSTGQEMKRNVPGCDNTSAQKWAERGLAYTVNRYASLEWCHLVGDCLGGLTVHSNLVAASFGANTEMLAIEHCLKGRAEFGVLIQAQCSKAHVAEVIIYNVKHMKSQKIQSWQINARNDYFTKDDFEHFSTG
ncbi:MAG: hypothetical protein QNK92_15900 [Amylibacter sp.]